MRLAFGRQVRGATRVGETRMFCHEGAQYTSPGEELSAKRLCAALGWVFM